MKYLMTILAAGLLSASQTEAATLEKALPGQWLSLCKKASGNYLQITSNFSADGAYAAKSVFYADAACKQSTGVEVVSRGKYRLGNSVSTARGASAREMDIDVRILESGGIQLPGKGQQIAQIVTIADDKLIFGDAPGLQAVTGGTRPQKLNYQFYSRKQ
ncbi:hypothetical protein [Microbulbifer hainanensis]|uniref:hypothetical protein n=1 Tax=Microbulbifer hainanensis TaxID=2735675 RepID=UPI0018680246|nr:hypothetical protein [Microbulbifer hainanensis]